MFNNERRLHGTVLQKSMKTTLLRRYQVEQNISANNYNNILKKKIRILHQTHALIVHYQSN